MRPDCNKVFSGAKVDMHRFAAASASFHHLERYGLHVAGKTRNGSPSPQDEFTDEGDKHTNAWLLRSVFSIPFVRRTTLRRVIHARGDGS